MKTKFIIALTAFVFIFSACQKDSEDTTDNGGGTTAKDYQPTTAGSTWQYESTSQGTYTETALGTDTTIDGQKFYAFDNTENGRRYVNNNNGIYTSYGYMAPIDTTLTLLYLKDAPQGTTWSTTSVYMQVPITLTYTIASRDGEKEVNGTNFKEVIALDFNVTAPNPLSGTTVTVARGQQYFAKGVGAILNTLHLDAAGVQLDDSTYLASYNIK